MLEVGKTYIIDKDSPNGGEVIVLEAFTHFCLVQDPKTGEKWSTMTYRLTDEEGNEVGSEHAREKTLERRNAISVQRDDLMKTALAGMLTTASASKGIRVAVVGGENLHHSHHEILMHRLKNAGVEIVHIDSDDLKAESMLVSEYRRLDSEPLLYSRPRAAIELATYPTEKKRKGECKRHEYIEHRSEPKDGFITSQWICKHCNKHMS